MKKLGLLLFCLTVTSLLAQDNQFKGIGSFLSPDQWSMNKLPTLENPGIINKGDSTMPTFIAKMALIQNGGRLHDFEDKGLNLRSHSRFTIEDARENYSEYTNLDISGQLTLWSNKANTLCELNIISGSVKAGELSLLGAEVSIKNGLLKAGLLTQSPKASITFLAKGKGKIIIADIGDKQLNQLYIEFEPGNQGSFTIGSKDRSTYDLIKWMIEQGRFLSNKVEKTDLNSFIITKDKHSTSIALKPSTIISI
ncbi:hypothetical protein PQO03_17835 [Lentisphaera profundi]|uniref:Uncharacterized protein n=1 Tax=Lentisphaera profundi TaxID=1658616 RepID=A0ABY7VYA3_9BACT|nr:hypothetical protein [Lentisphaera profundi]WDE97689.1 hypothetical protein PQO03_17835 [Lentisphaera profundi]